MSQSFYRKWRPSRWDQVVGQEHIIQTLRNAVVADRFAHAHLFAGPRGTGKTTTARILAKAVNCLDDDQAARPCDRCEHCLAVNEGRFLDLIEIDAASNTSVEDVRDLRDKINFSPNQGRYKIYLIDEVHMLSTAAFNALLKTLEEPPPHAIFILATTEVHKIPATVLSRCQQHEFRRIGVQDIVAQLNRIVEAEGLEAEEDALTLIARQATGSLRDAISLLDQMAGGGGVISLKKTHDVLGTATSHAVIEIVDSLIARDPSAGLDRIHAALDGGVDPRQFARQVVNYLRDLLLVRMENASQVDAPHDVRTRMASQASSFTPAELLRVIRAFNDAATERRFSWQPGIPLELAFVDSLELQEVENNQAGVGDKLVARDQSSTVVYEPSVPREEKTSTVPLQSSPAAHPQPAPQEDQPASPSSEGISLRMVQDRWDAVLSAVRRHNSSTQGLLNSCKVLELKGHDLYLGFASETVKSIMEKPPHIEAAQKSIEEVLGARLRIRCVIAAAGGRIPPEVEDDGMVATAVRLGGKIIDSSELPSRNK